MGHSGPVSISEKVAGGAATIEEAVEEREDARLWETVRPLGSIVQAEFKHWKRLRRRGSTTLRQRSADRRRASAASHPARFATASASLAGAALPCSSSML